MTERSFYRFSNLFYERKLQERLKNLPLKAALRAVYESSFFVFVLKILKLLNMWLMPYGIYMHQVCDINKMFHQVGHQNKFV